MNDLKGLGNVTLAGSPQRLLQQTIIATEHGEMASKKARSQPQLKTVRAFISSPFHGMDAGRDHLSTIVFPELQCRLQQVGLRFGETDLRWGLPDDVEEIWGVPQAGASGMAPIWRTWWACRQGIDDRAPFIIGIISDRYGTRLSASEIQLEQNVELRRYFESDANKWPGRSITEMEIRYGALDGQDHQLPGALFYFRTPIGLTGSVAPPPGDDDQTLLAQLKADILASGAIARDVSSDDVETFGRKLLEDLWSDILRSPNLVSVEAWQSALGAPPHECPEYVDRRLPIPESVWQEVVKSVGFDASDRVASAGFLHRDGVETQRYIANRTHCFFGRQQELRHLDAFIRDPLRGDSPVLLVTGQAGHGKTSLLCRFTENWAETDSKEAILIPYFAGSTAQPDSIDWVLHRAVQWLAEVGGEPVADHQAVLPVVKFQFAAALREISEERRVVLLIDGLDLVDHAANLSWLPIDPGLGVRLILSFATAVHDAESPEQGDSTVAIPGNELLKAFRELHQQPRVLTRNGVESLDEYRPLHGLRGLDRTNSDRLIKKVCRDRGKYLSATLRNQLTAIPQAGNPLYLTVLVSELCRLTGSGRSLHQLVPELIQSVPNERRSNAELFDWMIENVVTALSVANDSVSLADSSHTTASTPAEPAVAFWCAWLVSSRDGMSSSELAGLLAAKLGDQHRAVAFRVERLLRDYLQFRGNRLDFFHQGLRSAVEARFLPRSTAARSRFHADIADFFDTHWQSNDSAEHALSELPWHLVRSDRVERIGELLTDYRWLSRKLDAHGTAAVIDDFDIDPRLRAGGLEEIGNALRRSKPIIDSDSRQLASQILGRIDQESDFGQRLCRSISANLDTCSLTPLRPSLARADGLLKDVYTLHPGQRLRTFADPTDGSLRTTAKNIFSDVAVSSDARYVIAGYTKQKVTVVWDSANGALQHILPVVGRLQLLSDDTTLVVGELKGVSFSNIRSGRVTGRVGLEGSDREVIAIASSRDGSVVVVLTRLALTVYDVKSMSRRHHQPHGLDEVRLGAIAVDGDTVALVTSDNKLHVRALGGTDDRLTIDLHDCDLCDEQLEPSALTVSSNGRVAVVSSQQRFMIFGGTTSQDEDQFWFSAEQLAYFNGSYPLLTIDGTSKMNSISDLYGFDFADQIRSASGHRSVEVQRLIRDRNSLRVWELEAGTAMGTLQGHTKEVDQIRLSENPVQIVSGSADRSIQVYNVAAEQLRVLPTPEAAPKALATTPDGKHVVSGADDMQVRLWRVDSDMDEDRLNGPVTAVTTTRDGRLAVSGNTGGAIRVWDTATGTLVRTLNGHTLGVSCLLAASDSVLVSGGADGTLRVWNLSSGEQRHVIHTPHANVNQIKLSRRGRVLTTQSKVDNDSHAVMARAIQSIRNQIENPTDAALSRGSDGSASSIYIWDVESGNSEGCLSVDDAATHDFILYERDRDDFDKHDRVISVHGTELRVWDLATESLEFRLQAPEDHPVAGLTLMHGTYAVCPSFTGRLVRFELKEGTTSETIGDAEFSGDMRLGAYNKIESANHLFAITANGREFHTWIPLTRKHARTLSAHEDCITDFAVSTSGPFAVTVSADHQLILWNWHLGGVVGRFTADCELTCCALTPDGLTVIAGDHEGHVHLLRVDGAWADALRLRLKADNGSIESRLTELFQLRASMDLVRHPADQAWAGKAYVEACIACMKQSLTTFPSESYAELLGALDVCDVVTNGSEHLAWLGKHDVICSLFELASSVAKATKLDSDNCEEDVIRRLDIAMSAIESGILHCPDDWFGDHAGSTLSRLVEGEAALAIAYARAKNVKMACGFAGRASEHFRELLDADDEEPAASYTTQLRDTCAAIAESGVATYFDDQNAGLSRIADALHFLSQVQPRLKDVELPLDAVSDATSIVVDRFISDVDVQSVHNFVSGLARVHREPVIDWDDHWRSHQTWLFAKLARRLSEQGEDQQCAQVLTEMEALVRDIEDDRTSDEACGRLIDYLLETRDSANARRLIESLHVDEERIGRLTELVEVLMGTDQFDKSREVLQQAIAISERTDCEPWRLRDLARLTVKVERSVGLSSRLNNFTDSLLRAVGIANKITSVETRDDTLDDIVCICRDVIFSACLAEDESPLPDFDEVLITATFEHASRIAGQIVTPECMRVAQATLDEARAAWSIATMAAGDAQRAFDCASSSLLPHFRIRTSALLILRSETVDISRDFARLECVAHCFNEIDNDDLRNDIIEIVARALQRLAESAGESRSVEFAEPILAMTMDVRDRLTVVSDSVIHVECCHRVAQLLAAVHGLMAIGDRDRSRLESLRGEFSDLADEALSLGEELSELVHDLIQEYRASCFLHVDDAEACFDCVRSTIRSRSMQAAHRMQYLRTSAEEGPPCDVVQLLAEPLEILGSITSEQLASEHFVGIAHATYAQVLALHGNIDNAKAELAKAKLFGALISKSAPKCLHSEFEIQLQRAADAVTRTHMANLECAE